MDRLAKRLPRKEITVCIIVFAARSRLPDEPGGEMKVKVLAVMTAAFAASAGAEQKLDVFVNNGERIPFVTLQRAETLASRMFASADVRIAWHGVARSGWKGQNHIIIIQLELDTPAAYHPGALGCSQPYERVHVSIFYNRIRQMDQPNLEAVLLGHAMAH